MNSIKLLFGGTMVLVLSLAVWSCKDDFTERDLLNAQRRNDSLEVVQNNNLGKDSVALSIIVFNASTTSRTAGGREAASQGLAGITIKISTQGSIKTLTTSAEGIGTTWVQPGAVAGTLSGPGYATANFTISVTEAQDNSGETITNAAVEMPAFANTGALATTVSGVVTYEGNLLNNDRETVPNGTAISFEPSAASIASYYNSAGSLTNSNSNGADIDAYSLEGAFVATTTNGAFSITLPSGVNGITYSATFSDFTADQQLAIDRYEGDLAGSVRGPVTLSTRFSTAALPGNTFSNLGATVSPIQVDIADPPASGTGAAVTVSLLPQAIATSGFTVIASGSGYPVSSTTVPVTITGGDFDAAVTGSAAAVLAASTNASGQITAITGTLGSGYRSQATLTIGGGGSGAVVRVNYASTVANPFGTNAAGTSGTTITAGGSGYDTAPTLVLRGYDLNGNYIEEAGATVTVANGAVVGLGMPATTFAKLLAASPAIFRPGSRVAAIADGADFTVNVLGEVSLPTPGVGVGLTGGAVAQGSGYSLATPPTVTVRGLRGGTGATVGAELTTGGAINYLYLITRGSGYSTLANANFPISATAFSTSGVSLSTALRPGVTYTLNGYYGTGVRARGIQ